MQFHFVISYINVLICKRKKILNLITGTVVSLIDLFVRRFLENCYNEFATRGDFCSFLHLSVRDLVFNIPEVYWCFWFFRKSVAVLPDFQIEAQKKRLKNHNSNSN